MNKKILLGAAVALASLQVTAQPFSPTDARAMAMGGTGVASAKTVHAVQFNPSLLSGGSDSDDFGLLFPQVGGYVSDEDDFIDSADAFADADYATSFNDAVTGISAPLSNIQNALTAVNNAAAAGNDSAALSSATANLNTQVSSLTAATAVLTNATADLNGGLASISEKALRGGLGGGAGIAIPSKKFSVAISANNSTSFSGKLTVAQEDMDVLTDYTSATDAYANTLGTYTTATSTLSSAIDVVDAAGGGVTQAQLDAVVDAQAAVVTANTALTGFNYTGSAGNAIFAGGELANGADNISLNSSVSIIAIAISEVAVSLSREFTIANRQVAIGITPKMQRIDAYDYVVAAADETDTGDITDFGVEDTGFNLDIGASTKFGAQEQGTIGFVVKNLMSKDLDTVNGNTVSIAPQARVGVSYPAFGWINLAADLDLTENEPVAFEDPSQFLSLGAEADVFGFLQIRGGFRSNIASSDQDVMSFGLGLSPFGLFHVDFGFYANTSDPAKEAGGVFELGLDW